MVHGLLVDHDEEFFIQRTSLCKTAPTPLTAGVRAEQASNAWEWHQGFEVLPLNVPPDHAQPSKLRHARPCGL